MFILGKAYSVKEDNKQEEEAMKLYYFSSILAVWSFWIVEFDWLIC